MEPHTDDGTGAAQNLPQLIGGEILHHHRIHLRVKQAGCCAGAYLTVVGGLHRDQHHGQAVPFRQFSRRAEYGLLHGHGVHGFRHISRRFPEGNHQILPSLAGRIGGGKEYGIGTEHDPLRRNAHGPQHIPGDLLPHADIVRESDRLGGTGDVFLFLNGADAVGIDHHGYAGGFRRAHHPGVIQKGFGAGGVL